MMTEEFAGSTVTNGEPIKQFDSGAVRSDLGSVRYDLLHPVGMRRLAETYGEGAAKYGDFNWLKGMPLSQTFNHLIKHIFQYLEGDRSEDHLAHAGWGIIAAMVFEDTEHNDLYYSPRNVEARRVEARLEEIAAKVNELAATPTPTACRCPNCVYIGKQKTLGKELWKTPAAPTPAPSRGFDWGVVQ